MYRDFRIGKSIKCSSRAQILKVQGAYIYPTVGDEILYYNDYYDSYIVGKVTDYISPCALKINGVILTLKKDGHWTYKRDKVLYNVFDKKYHIPCLKLD